MWKQHARPAVLLFLALTVLTGVLYPLAIAGVGALLFPERSAGSLIERNGQPVGSRLIGQPFSDPKYFWGRPSATTPFPYNAAASAGSNLGPTSDAFKKEVAERLAAIRAADPENDAPVPVELLTASGSGLDPDISPAAARYQVRRVARARGLDARVVERLVGQRTEGRLLGLIGEPRVNVLELNLALDRLRGG